MAEIKKKRKNKEQRGLCLEGVKIFRGPEGFPPRHLVRCLFPGLGPTEQWDFITLALLTLLLTGLEPGRIFPIQFHF